MKSVKILAALAALTMTCTMASVYAMPETVITADAAIYGQLAYDVQKDGTIVITDCAKDAVMVEIPAEIGGKKVTEIGAGACDGCDFLTSVTIPDSVICIGQRAFSGCTNLTDITVPDHLTSIGWGALDNTAWYEAQPDGIVYLGNWVLGYKGEMPENTSLILENGTLGIAECAFESCTGLTDITIPEGLVGIGALAFRLCKSLTGIALPDSVTYIGSDAFSGCTGLTEIVIPDKVTVIESYAFWRCTSLTSVTIPDGVTDIERNAFFECVNLTNIDIPDNVTHIGAYAFDTTKWLSDRRTEDPLVVVNGILIDGKTCSGAVIIPDDVTSIAENAFDDCTDLTDVVIPRGVTDIGTRAFGVCAGLENITVLNPDCEIADYAHTIRNGYDSESEKHIYTGAITGYENSTAQAYAEKYGRTFVSLGEAPKPEYKTGDVDGDGGINAVDASLLLAAAALAGQGQPSGLTPAQETAADVDGKNGFNAVDASYILQYAAFAGNNPGVDISIKEFISGI